MKVGLIGLGNMGTAVANLVAYNGHNVIGWEYNEDVVEEINSKNQNSKCLPGIKLDSKVKATKDVKEVFHNCEMVFIAIPSAFIRNTLLPFSNKINQDILIVNMAKGIENNGFTSCQILSSLFPENRVLMFSGPSIANEFARQNPSVVILAGENNYDLLRVSQILDNRYFRTRFSHDLIGVELGGILKNVYAIGLGIFDGIGIKSINFKAAYLTIALEEMTNIGISLGAEKGTFSYFAGMGDLLATSLSEHSHNRRMGELLAKGLDVEEIKSKMSVLPEGYNTLKNILYLSEKTHTSMPLAAHLWNVIGGKEKPEKFVYAFIKDFI